MFEPAMARMRCIHLPLPLTVLTLLISSTLAIAPTKAVGTEKPNVVLIIVEDLNDWVGCLGGHPGAKTPHIDRLAKRGVLFANAHCSAPVCNPSRTSFLSGLRPSTSGVYHNGDPATAIKADYTPLQGFFKSQGYYTMTKGKIGLAADVEFDEYGPKHKNPRPKEAGRYNGNLPPLGGFGLHLDDDAMADAGTADWVAEKLQADYDKPFFLAAGFSKVHRPLWVPKKYFDQFSLESVEMPPLVEHDLTDIPPVGRAIARSRWKHRTSQGTDHEIVLENDVWRENVRAYLACIAFLDTMIGRVVDALESSPYRDNTVVVFLSDHGFHIGEKEHWTKFTLWEEATRVPLVVHAPGIATRAGRCDRPVSLLDIYPTLVELCGLPSPKHLEGQSLVPLLQDPSAVREAPAVTSYGPENHAIRSDRWRYIRYRDGSEELYDHDQDPHEWHNLASDPQYTSVKGELSRWLPRQSVPSTRPDPFRVEVGEEVQ